MLVSTSSVSYTHLVVQIDALTVDRKGQVSTLKKTCHQPMDIIFHKSIGCFHKAILDGFHRSFHVHPGITRHELQYIIQCVNIGSVSYTHLDVYKRQV